jgi:hypothetical protein
MKKLITLLMLATAVSYSNISNAQDDAGNSPSISVGVEVGIPTGDFGESHKLGLGGTVKAAFPVITNGDITVTAGYISFSGKDVAFFGKLPAMNVIPLKAGFRYRFPGGFYVEPQFGYNIWKAKGGESEGGFTYAGNLGYLINNMIDLSVRYEGTSIEGTTISHIGFRAAYSFSLGGK